MRAFFRGAITHEFNAHRGFESSLIWCSLFQDPPIPERPQKTSPAGIHSWACANGAIWKRNEETKPAE